MSKREDWPNERVAAIYEKKGANLTAASTAIGIARRTLVRWREADSDLDALMKDIEESLVDFSESKLMAAISEGNLTAIIFHLKTKGKGRGYVERMENNVSVNPFEDLMKSIPDDDE